VPSFNGQTWLSKEFENLKLETLFRNDDTKSSFIIIKDESLNPIAIIYETADGSFVNDESNNSSFSELFDSNVLESEVFFNKLFLFGSDEIVSLISEKIRKTLLKLTFKENQYRADLIISDGQGSNISTTKLLTGVPLITEAYPYIEDLEAQIDSFIESNQTIMLMQGPPGTGKTTLIKYIASKMLGGQVDKRALLANITTDDEMIKASQFKRIIKELIKPYNALIVLEDADAIVQSRKSGNSAITPLFTLIDGLFSINNKWIFTTNLEDTKKIDSALLRPGRCHSFIKTRELTKEELEKLAKKLNIESIEIDKSMTLAEFFHKTENRKYGHIKNKDNASGDRKIGFV
jgi:hypothetical protein